MTQLRHQMMWTLNVGWIKIAIYNRRDGSATPHHHLKASEGVKSATHLYIELVQQHCTNEPFVVALICVCRHPLNRSVITIKINFPHEGSYPSPVDTNTLPSPAFPDSFEQDRCTCISSKSSSPQTHPGKPFQIIVSQHSMAVLHVRSYSKMVQVNEIT